MPDTKELYKKGAFSGLRKGFRSFLWVLKILLPITFLISLAEWQGWIYEVEFIFQPIMPWLGLPPMAALPLILGMISGIYAGIAAMSVLPFTKEEMTLLAIFLMLAHSLPQEGLIQGKSGFHPLKATLIRLGTATIVLFFVSSFLEVSPEATAVSSPPYLASSFANFLQNWFIRNLILSLKILGIIWGLFIFLEVCRSVGWIDYIIRWFFPILKIHGLSSKSAIVWITGTIFGLIYGAAIVLEELKEGKLPREELEKLHIAIGLQHSVIEDPLLFLALGINPLWLWIPRFLITLLVGHIYILAKKALGLWGIKFHGELPPSS